MIVIALMATTQVFAQVHYTTEFYMPEFSGCISRPGTDDGYFWTCSDERREKAPDWTNPAPKDAIWEVQFSDGAVIATNSYTPELNDMEGMAADTNGGFFVTTSQSLSTDMTFGSASNRCRLAHFNSSGALEGVKYDFQSSITNNYKFLTNYWMMLPKHGGLDVEGIAYDHPGNRMWVGLRGPLVATNRVIPGGYAVLLSMTNVLNAGGNFNTNTFAWDTNAYPRLLDLGGEGVRDLFYDAATTNLFILTGKLQGAETVTDGQGNMFTNREACHLLAYKPSNSNLTFCLRLPQVPSTPSNTIAFSEAEGICAIMLDGVKKLLVTYDSKTNGVYQAFDFPDPTTFANPDKKEGYFGM
jgi:hypothetical protein